MPDGNDQTPRATGAHPAAGVAATAASRRLSDGPVELIISWLLRIGVWLSIATVALGLVLLVVRHHAVLLQRQSGGLEKLLSHDLPGQPSSLNSYGEVLLAVRHGNAYGVIMLGLLILLVTPVLRVAVSIVAFLLEHDRLYALITLLVLLLLLTGIVLGRAGG